MGEIDTRNYHEIKEEYITDVVCNYPESVAVEDTYDYTTRLYDVLSLSFDIREHGNFWQCIKDGKRFFVREGVVPTSMINPVAEYTFEGVLI